MANAVYRNSSSTPKNREHDRGRGNVRATSSVESEARALLLSRHDDTEETKTPPEEKQNESPSLQEDSSASASAPSSGDNAEPTVRERLRMTMETPRASNRFHSRDARQGERKQGELRDASKGWPLNLTPSLILMFVVFELVTLSFFFLFGLIVGKGTVPPPQQAELEQILPEEVAENSPSQEILPQEALRFMTNLKTDESAEEQPQNTQAAATGNGEAQSKKESSFLDDDSNLYDFVIRVAAFKNEEQADALRARLEGAGMRTRLQKEKAQKGTWHFVLVLFRGTEVKMNKLRETFPSFGVRDSILVSKTPVE